MANENNPCVEEPTSSRHHVSQRQIPLNACESAGWAQPTTPEKPTIARVNLAQDRRNLEVVADYNSDNSLSDWRSSSLHRCHPTHCDAFANWWASCRERRIAQMPVHCCKRD